MVAVAKNSNVGLDYWLLGPAAVAHRFTHNKVGWQKPHAAVAKQPTPSGAQRVIGISCYYHDSAAAFVDGESIVFAVQEERLSRRKGDARFPTMALSKALAAAGSIDAVEELAFYENPQLKFERIWFQILHDWPNEIAPIFGGIVESGVARLHYLMLRIVAQAGQLSCGGHQRVAMTSRAA
jgi:hypothetical protein